MEQILYKLNPWWEVEFHTKSIPRPKYRNKLSRFLPLRDIVLLTGLRRVGKTTIIKQLVEELLQEVKPELIFYVSLDAYGLEKHSIHEIVTRYRTIHRLGLDQKIYVFLDEIAFKEDFQRELKDFYDNERYVHFKKLATDK